MCQTLTEALVKNGHEVDVVTSGMRDLDADEERAGVGVYRVKCFRRNRFYSTTPELLTQILPSYRKALELIRTNNYDCIHSHFIVPSGIVAYFLKKKTGLPYVITAYGSDIPGYNPDRFSRTHRLIRPFWKRIVLYSDLITSASHFLKALIQENIDVPVTVIPNAFTPTTTSRRVKRKRILVAARLVERKGVQFLIEASEGLSSGWEIFIAGDGPYLPELKRLADKVKTPIHFSGFLQRDELEKLYQTSSIFVFPSLQENFPMVLLEAMAAGCAVITTDTPGCSEVVGEAAIRVAPENAQQLQEARVKLTSDEASIAHYSRLDRERVERFSARGVAKQLEDAFSQVIDP